MNNSFPRTYSLRQNIHARKWLDFRPFRDALSVGSEVIASTYMVPGEPVADLRDRLELAARQTLRRRSR